MDLTFSETELAFRHDLVREAALAMGVDQAPAQKKAANLRLWILKTYVEPTNKAIEASAARWAQKNGGSVTVEYFTFEDMQTKYVAAIENKSTPDVGQLETGAPAIAPGTAARGPSDPPWASARVTVRVVSGRPGTSESEAAASARPASTTACGSARGNRRLRIMPRRRRAS